MKRPLIAFCVTALPLLSAAAEDPFAALAEEARPLQTRWQTDYIGTLELGVDYVTDDNFMFGRYNGNDEDEAQIYGNVDWRWATSYGNWDIQGTDIGTDIPFARIQWDRNNLSIYFELEGTKQISNDSGRTPFSGDDNLLLPTDWLSSNVTSGFTNLDSALHGVDQELERDRYTLGLSTQINSAWKLESSVQYEEKDGGQDVGAAIFQDASVGHSAILLQPVDYESLEFDLSLNFKSKHVLLNGSLFYNEFDNNNDLLQWQNPYDIFGPAVRYPNGNGGLGLAPDNEYMGGRLLGTWFINSGLRLQVDGSYAETEQDQNYAAYTANDDLTVNVPLPRNSLDGTIETSTLDTRLFYRPLPRLNLELWWHGEQRESDQSRDPYQYVLGDGGSQVASDWTVYNTGHDYSINRAGIEGSYPLPWRSKIWLKYEYYKVERENSAVEETEEDRYSLKYRIPILPNLNSRLELLYADRAASTYNWDQSYYALLDTGLINRTPDNQRYITHPQLAQYQLANRERSEVKLDLDWQPAMDWSVGLNVLWRDDEFDKTDLGLEEEEVTRVGGTVSWLPNQRLSVSAYASYDDYQRDQNNRSFRGGIEKNAFEIYPPLPQASDPSRNWSLSNEDEVVTLGLNVEWQLRENISLTADYSYVSTDSDYDFSDGGAADLSSEPLPADDDSDQHHLIVEGAYNLRDNLTIKVDYQYWRYDSEDWAIHDLGPTSIDKVLTLGEQEADEDLHYIGTSIIYRWQ
jgi:MtrB/PioB family decaheme-associated outer membrane protein